MNEKMFNILERNLEIIHNLQDRVTKLEEQSNKHTKLLDSIADIFNKLLNRTKNIEKWINS
jgi:hypothetical protein